MPGSARNNSQRMYQDEYYYSLFGSEAQEGVIADTLKISWYYDKFLKSDLKNEGYDEKTVLPMIKNGKTFQLASIAFLCKIQYDVFTYDTVASLLNNTDQLRQVLRSMGGMTQIISRNINDEESAFYTIFGIIGDEVLGYCFSNALDSAEEDHRTLAPSDYLKSDNSYYRDVLKRLWRIYSKNPTLRDIIVSLCGTT